MPLLTFRIGSNCAPHEHHWLVIQGIEVSDMYNLADARTMLSNTFTYTGLKIFGGIDIDGVASRLQGAKNGLMRLIRMQIHLNDSLAFDPDQK